MTRRTIALSVLSGAALASGVLVARPDAAPAPPATAADQVRAIDAAALRVERDSAIYDRYWARRATGFDAASARIVVQAKDPAGGPDWALRTFTRRPLGAKGRPVWCSQLGRIVQGEFVWVRPGAATAEQIGLDVEPLTSCATTSPIAQRRLSVQVATLPDRPLHEAGAQPAATVIWGAVGGQPASAELAHDTAGGPIEVRRHGFLKVLSGATRAGRTLLRVTDPGGGRRAAIPPGYWWFDGLQFRPPGGQQPQPSAASVEQTYRRTPAPGLYALAGSRQLPGKPPTGIFAKLGAKEPCATSEMQLLGERPARSLSDDATGLVSEIPERCSPAFRSAGKRPVFLGSSWASGLDDRPLQRAEMRRRRIELRRAYESGTVVLGVPPGTKMVEVRSPIGVTVVRVRAGRVTFISWNGQPDVGKALHPQLEARAKGRARIRIEEGVSFRALDAAGRQIGQPLSTRRR